MDLYNLIIDQNNQLCARDPQHILEVVKHFCAREKEGLADDENYIYWIYQKTTTVDEIKKVAGSHVAEGVKRVREGNVHIAAGYDGEYGTIKISESQNTWP